MAKVVTDDKHYKELADLVREWTPDPRSGEWSPLAKYKPESIRPMLIEFAQSKVSDAWQEGNEEGRQTAHRTFWDEFQKKGKRRDYYCGFAGYGWHAGTFYPMYNIKPSNANQMFWYFGQMGSISKGNAAIDLVARLEECGVSLDFSECTKFSNAFAYARFTRVGVIDTTSCGDLTKIFAHSCMTTIDELRLRPEGGQTFTAAFDTRHSSSLSLENVKVTGKISTSIDLKRCWYLSKESILSFMDALSDTAVNKTITLEDCAVFKYNVHDSTPRFTSEEWEAVVAAHPNWDIWLHVFE